MSSACLPLLRSVSSTFFIGVVDQFCSDLFNELKFLFHLRNDSLILAEISLLLVFGSKGPQNRAFCKVFRTFYHFISLKQSERRIIVVLDFPFQIPCLAKFYNHVHNILRLFDDSAKFLFTTSEAEHDH